jgi:hypothetical protein
MKFFFLKKTKKIKLNKWEKNKILTNRICFSNISSYALAGSHRVIKKFLSINQKKGLKKKLAILFSKVFLTIFKFFKNNNFTFLNDLQNLIELQQHNFILNKNLYFLNIIFKNLLKMIQPTFHISFLNKKNKKNKKKDVGYKKFKAKIAYVFPEQRENIALRWLILYSNHFNDKTFFHRIFKSLFYTFVERKTSFLYIKKIETYSLFSDKKLIKKNS